MKNRNSRIKIESGRCFDCIGIGGYCIFCELRSFSIVLFCFFLFSIKGYCVGNSVGADLLSEIERGHYESASALLKKHLSSHSDDYDAMLQLIKVAKVTGEKRTLIRYRHILRNLYSSGKLNRAPALTAYGEVVSDSDPKGALFLFDKAHKVDKSYIEAYLREGDLCYERYDWERARSELENALKLAPDNCEAVAGLAVLDIALGQISSASERLKGALKKHPDSLALLIPTAYIALIEEDFSKCSELLKHAEKVNSFSIDLLSVYAAMYEIEAKTDKRDEYIKRAVSINPSSVAVYNLLSTISEQKYRFKKAVEWAEKAIKADPSHWRGYYLAGNNLLHLGEERKGYKLLSESFAKNSFNVMAYNILNVLDRDFKYHEVNTYETEHLVVKIAKTDVPFIWPYLEPLLEATYQKFTNEFAIKPLGSEEHKGKVLLHILPDHESFSVRTMGLPGISANGVCFGQVMLMPSPRYVSLGNTRGMNWKSVFEHEFLHILTLQKSDYKISRWLTLNPRYPMQVPVSYYQAAMTCRYFKERYGEQSILKMIELYRAGKSTDEVVEEASGKSIEELNKELEDFYNQQGKRGEEFVNTFASEIKEVEGKLKVKDKGSDKRSEKKREGERKWEKLVRYWRNQGDNDKAVKILNKLLQFDDSDFKIFKVLGEIYCEEKSWKSAADILLRAIYRNPFDRSIHEMAAESYKQLKMEKEEEREKKILLLFNNF